MTPNSGPLELTSIGDEVLPKIKDAGWSDDQIEREYTVNARNITTPSGLTRSHKDGFIDIVLSAHPGTPTAAVEAKRRYRTAESAIQQAIRYAEQLDVPLAYGTNGGRIIERNLHRGTEREAAGYHSPAEAWGEYCAYHGLNDDGAASVGEPPSRARQTVSGAVVEPRYYQTVAINRVLAAIASGQQRVLLLMATGTGKTFTAMQIVHKLRERAKVTDPDKNYRVLYLADRDQLLTQPMRKDFIPPFGANTVARVKGGADTSREIYFASYQALTGDHTDDSGRVDELMTRFRQDFFNLVIVDECHRGSAKDGSSWRSVLDYFSSAVQLGLTATPLQGGTTSSIGCVREADDNSATYEYFGNPVYRYSLRQGIEDGYLAPYRVRRVVLTPDKDGWQPYEGQLDRFGKAIPDGLYGTRDFERVVSLLAPYASGRHPPIEDTPPGSDCASNRVLRRRRARRRHAQSTYRREPRSCS